MALKNKKYYMMKFKSDLPAKAADDIALKRVISGIDKKTRPRNQILIAASKALLNESFESAKAFKKDLIRGKFADDK